MKVLGQNDAKPSRDLDTIPNTIRNLAITLRCTEFTCRCPVTGQPDFAHLVIEYEPDQLIVESKSFKLYLETYREEGIFHEHLAQQILNDVVSALQPIRCKVTVQFNVRGGIAIDAAASYENGEVYA